METYYAGETIIVNGTLTDEDSTAFDFVDFTTFQAVVSDTYGNSYTYTKAGATIAQDTASNSYYFEITPTQTGNLKGIVKCVITATFLDADYSVTSTDIARFDVGFISH